MDQLMHSIYLRTNPIFSRIASKNPSLMWACAFSISILQITLQQRIKSIASLARSATSRICLLSTKAFWNLETSFHTPFSIFCLHLTQQLIQIINQVYWSKVFQVVCTPFLLELILKTQHTNFFQTYPIHKIS